MDYALWCKSPALQAELREILNHPTLKIALAIVKDTGLPSLGACPFDNCTFIEWQAIKAGYSQGYFDHERNLTQLANVPEAHVKAAGAAGAPTLGPWEHLKKSEEPPTISKVRPVKLAKKKAAPRQRRV